MSRPVLVIAFAILLAFLIVRSTPRRVGDGAEYMAMTLNFAAGAGPAIDQERMGLISRRLEAMHSGFGGFSFSYPYLRDRNGGQLLPHFWLYSLLAVPPYRLARSLGWHENFSFVFLNVALLLATVWVVSGRLGLGPTILLMGGPILWWIDKAHAEVFTFSLLSIGFALLRTAPWWSLVCLGVVSAQYPPMALLIPIIFLVITLADRDKIRERRLWIGGVLACGFASMHPLYYLTRLGILSPFSAANSFSRPTLPEYVAVLLDPNIGLAFHFPVLIVVVIGAALALGLRARSRLLAPELLIAGLSALVFMLLCAENGNVNSGGTPGMSRYGLWFIPLSIPLLQQVESAFGRTAARWLVPIGVLSCAWSAVSYRPNVLEKYLQPTWAASAMWASAPSVHNPLPEIFAERVSGREPGLLPSATNDCSKVLLEGGRWPIPCPPMEPPAFCAAPGTLCYANRAASGYRFARVNSVPKTLFARDPALVWSQGAADTARTILQRVHWWELTAIGPGEPGRLIVLNGQATMMELQGRDRTVGLIFNAGSSLTLGVRSYGPLNGYFVDLERGDALELPAGDETPSGWTSLAAPVARGPLALILSTKRH